MSEQQRVPLFEPESESQKQVEKRQRLRTIFTDLEGRQPDFLDEAAKSIIERIATFLAILFAAIALGGTFPPKFLIHNARNTFLVIAILICYLLAMGMGMWAIQPHSYDLYLYNMTRQEKEWKRIISRKKFWVRFAGILFGVGTVALAVLIIFIILPL
jgi:hypothetical protein